MSGPAWDDVIDYLGCLGAHDVLLATDRLDRAIDRDGIGAINDALGDACRALMDRVLFPAGTIDVLAVIDRIAMRIVETTGDARREALDRQRSLLVFLGSEGLPCAARNDVASWGATDRLHDLIAATIGLLGIVAEDEGLDVADIVPLISPPGAARAIEGSFTLAWRGANGAEPLAGVMPRGYTANITFLGADACSLRSIFARVANLRGVMPFPTPTESRPSWEASQPS